ncbi:MAG: MarC family protein [Lentisphaeria bacterium]
MISLFFSVWIKIFFVFAPFFALSMFLTLSRGLEKRKRRGKAVKIAITVMISCYILYFFGDVIFKIFGITVDSFRVGAGILLFFTAIDLVRKSDDDIQAPTNSSGDFTIVPMTIPITVGPATIGTLMVMGAENNNWQERIIGCAGLTAAVITLGILLYIAVIIENFLGQNVIRILSKLTGLVLSAIASQLVLDGARNILFG